MAHVVRRVLRRGPGLTTPTLEVVGDWTSGSLLTRLMAAIASPWEVDSRGFVNHESGERCTVEMRGPDPSLRAAMRAGDDPERPTLTDEVMEAIAGHRSVLRVRASGEHEGTAALRALVAMGDGLADAGGRAVWCPESGAARSAEAWQDLADVVLLGSKKERLSALSTAFVRPLVRVATGWTTRGMVFLDAPDVAVDGSVAEPLALDAIRVVTQRLLERAPLERLKAHLGPRTIEGRRADDPNPRTDPAFNPRGRFQLTLR